MNEAHLHKLSYLFVPPYQLIRCRWASLTPQNIWIVNKDLKYAKFHIFFHLLTGVPNGTCEEISHPPKWRIWFTQRIREPGKSKSIVFVEQGNIYIPNYLPKGDGSPREFHIRSHPTWGGWRNALELPRTTRILIITVETWSSRLWCLPQILQIKLLWQRIDHLISSFISMVGEGWAVYEPFTGRMV